MQQQQQQQQHASGLGVSSTSMPWAAAVKSPPDQHLANSILNAGGLNHNINQASVASSFDLNQTSSSGNTIGSWSSPETNTSNRGGWNADGSNKCDGALDDGTSIWGNPTSKKTGIDWAEKDSLMNPPKPSSSQNSEKRAQKQELAISSINGTEAWGTPQQHQAPIRKSSTNSQPQQQQFLKTSDNSSNSGFGIKPINETITNYNTNSVNDLKHIGAIDSLELATRNSSSNNQQSQLLDSAAYNSMAVPSRDLLKQMVHQIQLAVQAGHLNAHILNQPLSNPTLQLVYQLLQQIKNLHQLQAIQQHATATNSSIGEPINIELQINKTRQNIAQYQKAIAQQQQQQQQSPFSDKQDESTFGDNSLKQQQQQLSNNFSYATISKLSTNLKASLDSSNLDSFNKSSLIDTLSNSNVDSLRLAQSKFDANSTSSRISSSSLFDKSLSSLIQASSTPNNILAGNNNINSNQNSCDYPLKAPGFNNNTGTSARNSAPVGASGGLLGAQSASAQQHPPTSSTTSSSTTASSSSSAWSAFSSGDFMPQKAWPNQLRISANVSQQEQQNATNSVGAQFGSIDYVPDFRVGKSSWCSSSLLSGSSDEVTARPPDNKTSCVSNAKMAPGSNLARPNSSSNTLKQAMNNSNNILNSGDSASGLFCDWSSNASDNRDFDRIASVAAAAAASEASSPSSSAFSLGGISLQSNPWMFSPQQNHFAGGTSLTRNSIADAMNKSTIGTKFMMDNGNLDKSGGDSLFLKSNKLEDSNNERSSSSALYDWSSLTVSASAIQTESPQQLANMTPGSSNATHGLGLGEYSRGNGTGISKPARSGPPPGLVNSFGSLVGNQSANNVSLFDSKQLSAPSDDNHSLQARDAASNVWSSGGAWFD